MTPETPTKRGRGGQPGNQNAKGNRGNLSARGKFRNRGGTGAPRGNQFARKHRTLDIELLKEFQHCPDALAWIESNAGRLRDIVVSDDSRVSFGAYMGLTPEVLAEKGHEYRHGLYYEPERDEASGGGAP
jgi:hypothetical protein